MVDLCYYFKSSGCQQMDRGQKVEDIGQRFVIGHAEFQLYGFRCAATVDVARVSLLVLSWCTRVLLFCAAILKSVSVRSFLVTFFHLAVLSARAELYVRQHIFTCSRCRLARVRLSS